MIQKSWSIGPSAAQHSGQLGFDAFFKHFSGLRLFPFRWRIFWHEERHPVLAADDGLGDRHNRAAVAEELDPEIGAGQPGSLLK